MRTKSSKSRLKYKIDTASYPKGIEIVCKKPQSLFGQEFLNCIYFKVHQKPGLWGWVRCEMIRVL